MTGKQLGACLHGSSSVTGPLLPGSAGRGSQLPVSCCKYQPGDTHGCPLSLPTQEAQSAPQRGCGTTARASSPAVSQHLRTFLLKTLLRGKRAALCQTCCSVPNALLCATALQSCSAARGVPNSAPPPACTATLPSAPPLPPTQPPPAPPFRARDPQTQLRGCALTWSDLSKVAPGKPLTAGARQDEGFHLYPAAAFGNCCEQWMGIKSNK